MTGQRTAVILAVCDTSPAADRSVRAFFGQLKEGDQLILVGSTARKLASDLGTIDRIEAPKNALVPALWAEGLKNVDAECVAFSTTQMIPHAHWLELLRERLIATTAIGVGGCILPSDHLKWIDRGVYLQRFAAYGEPFGGQRPSGENAIYRRASLLAVQVGWAEGFWEVEVQQAVEARFPGTQWPTSPEAIVHFQGKTRLVELLRQRVQHAARFGSERSKAWRPLRKMARLLSSPLVPGVLLARAFRHLSRARRLSPRWLPAIPHFLAIASAWTLGEAVGIARGISPASISQNE